MTKFKHNDKIRIGSWVDASLRPGAIVWVVGAFENRPLGQHFAQFPEGVVYTVEYEDGKAIDIHENNLEQGPWQTVK